MEKLNRRKFFGNSISFSASMSLLPWMQTLLGDKLLMAAETSAPIRRLVWINMSGGWDILEVTDPKTASTNGIDMIYDYGLSQTITGSNEKIGRWLPNIASLGADLLVIRGVAMGTTSHAAGSVYMNTGILSNTGEVNAASIPAIVASESLATVPIIQLNGGSEVQIDRGLLKPISVVRASNLNLYQTMYPKDQSELQNKLYYLDYLKSSIAQTLDKVGANDRLSALENAEGKIRTQFVNDVGSNLQVTDADRADFGQLPDGVNRGMLDSFALALKLLKNNLVTCINLGIGGFDTHSGQTARLEPTLTSSDFYIGKFAQALKTSGNLDNTLIVVYSDFGRTPKINGSNGRDHWPVNGALMIGGGIAGGRVVGGTDDNLNALSINATTGAIDANGTQISPVHVGGSILELTLGSAYLNYRPYLTALPALTRLK